MIEKLHGTRETVDFSIASSVRLYRNENSECFPPHWHVPGEIISPIKNTYQVTTGGKTLDLSPKDILIVAPGELHSIIAPPTGARYIVNFDTSPYERFQDLTFLFSTMSPFYLLRREDNPQLSSALFSLLEQIEGEYFGEGIYRESEISSLLLHFFVLLGRSRGSSEKLQGTTLSKQQEYSDRFMLICNYINAHCTENLSLEQIAEQAGFSKYHFSRLFKELTGTTCHNYLINRRILFAQTLLMDSSVSITEVAMRSGFNSLATFNRIFKTQMGCTPSEYRKLGADICHS